MPRILILLGLCVFFISLVWFTALIFLPVPWPDDSAFYFVAKDLMQWPPKWVMLPQAPFVPSYAEFNFNTMPLYPLLIALLRLIGLDGVFNLKFLPLTFWAASAIASGVIFCSIISSKKLYPIVLISLVYFTDPSLRWASVIARPESLIGLLGLLILFFLLKEKPKYGKFYDPVSICLALAAYAHFNAIHLLPMVIVFYFNQPKRLLHICLKTALYLTPWFFTVIYHFDLFITQMKVQFTRLNVSNNWLDTFQGAITSLNQQMGSPNAWDSLHITTAVILWGVILGAFTHWIQTLYLLIKTRQTPKKPFFLAVSTWVLSSVYLWHNKPESWFVFYIHLSGWTWLVTGFATIIKNTSTSPTLKFLKYATLTILASGFFCNLQTGIQQWRALAEKPYWSKQSYNDWIRCIDRRLSANANGVENYSVWAPTFPDITIELSRLHPAWSFTRTNDFHEKNDLALLHAKKVDAVVISETINYDERNLDRSLNESDPSEVKSIWLNWKDYYLSKLNKPEFKKNNRYICQNGRWAAFILFKDDSVTTTQSSPIKTPDIYIEKGICPRGDCGSKILTLKKDVKAYTLPPLQRPLDPFNKDSQSQGVLKKGTQVKFKTGRIYAYPSQALVTQKPNLTHFTESHRLILRPGNLIQVLFFLDNSKFKGLYRGVSPWFLCDSLKNTDKKQCNEKSNNAWLELLDKNQKQIWWVQIEQANMPWVIYEPNDYLE